LPVLSKEFEVMSNRVSQPNHTTRVKLALAFFTSLGLSGCSPAAAVEPAWPPAAKEWYTRALASYAKADQSDAEMAIQRALQADPQRQEVRTLAAQIALANLDYPAVLAHTDGLTSADARGLRARAHWYAGELEAAAEDLEQLLSDPSVHDGWGSGVLQLARQGHGRAPFSIKKGSRLAVTELTPAAERQAMVVPLELNGQPVLGLLSTGSSEVVIDSAGGVDPSWVTLRFGGDFEIKDVPALTEDLSGVERDLKEPIKVLVGINLLRRLNATFDLMGRQFVVRSYEAPPPPLATKLPVQYVKGGGMVVRSRLGAGSSASNVALFVDSREDFSIALDEEAWKTSGVRPDSFIPVPGRSPLRQARLGVVRLGAFDIPSVPAWQGVESDLLEKALGTSLDGRLGSGLLGSFRVSFADGGRALWLEELAASLPSSDANGATEGEGGFGTLGSP
jgi:hypothetical protein